MTTPQYQGIIITADGLFVSTYTYESFDLAYADYVALMESLTHETLARCFARGVVDNETKYNWLSAWARHSAASPMG